MIKKFLNYQVCLVIVLSIIVLIFFGALLKHHYSGGKKFQTLQKIAIFFAEIPVNTRLMFSRGTINIDAPGKPTTHIQKDRFTRYISKKRDGILVLPRYDHSLKRSIVDIIDLNNFKVIHTYSHNISEMIELVSNDIEYKRIKIDASPIRFEYKHPLILNDGSLISDSDYTPLFKIDFCSNLVWINQEEIFHHSKELDYQNNLWVPGQLYPFSKHISKFKSLYGSFIDDAIIKLNLDGKIIFKKSVSEILLENKKIGENLLLYRDPIHLNDIEPVLSDSKYWKMGDVFLSLRNQSVILHYRPSTNELINFIKGPFFQQHDVDIISSKEISIFNNNNNLMKNNSEVLIYNFENQKFTKKFNNQLKESNFYTHSQGLSQFLNDGSLLVEEQNHGRIILFNSFGQKEWEFVNKDKNGDIGLMSWSRVIEDEIFIKKYKSLINDKKCKN